jgi:hypothetical protein
VKRDGKVKDAEEVDEEATCRRGGIAGWSRSPEYT